MIQQSSVWLPKWHIFSKICYSFQNSVLDFGTQLFAKFEVSVKKGRVSIRVSDFVHLTKDCSQLVSWQSLIIPMRMLSLCDEMVKLVNMRSMVKLVNMRSMVKLVNMRSMVKLVIFVLGQDVVVWKCVAEDDLRGYDSWWLSNLVCRFDG